MSDRYPVTHDPRDPQTAHMVIPPGKAMPEIKPAKRPSRFTAWRKAIFGCIGAIGVFVGAMFTIQPDATPQEPPPLEYLNPTERVLAADYQTTVKVDGATYRVTIKAGFRTDGASIPATLRWPLGLGPHHPALARGALVHDALYQSELCQQRLADKILLALILEDGCEPAKAKAVHRAVAEAGGIAYTCHKDAEVLAAQKMVKLEVIHGTE